MALKKDVKTRVLEKTNLKNFLENYNIGIVPILVFSVFTKNLLMLLHTK